MQRKQKKKKNIFFKSVAISLLVTFFIFGFKYSAAKYELLRSLVFPASTYYFEVTPQATTSTSYNFATTIAVDNNDGTNFMTKDLNYTISSDNNNFNVTVIGGLDRVIAGGDINTDFINLNVTPVSSATLAPIETINLTFTVNYPYNDVKTVTLKLGQLVKPIITSLTATEGPDMNTIALTPNFTGNATKLYYVAVDASAGYTPTDSASLIDFVLNGTNTNLANSAYTGAHIARGEIAISGSGKTYDLTGDELGLAGDAGLVGGVKYNIYVVVQYENDATMISNMANLGYYQLAQGFDGGFGTVASPYQIESADALAHMNYSVYNTNANLNYELEKDVDLSSYSNWTPIGNATTPFVGIFDGQGNSISNLTINNATATEVGLFGASKGIIKNVGISSGDVKSTNTVGTKTGGLVGYVLGGSISGCYSNASVSAVTGIDSGGATGAAGAGGLIGTIGGGTATNPITITDSHSSGSINGNIDVGGFVGDTMQSSYVNISKCYSTGDVSNIANATSYQLGGFVGRTNGNTTITNAYSTSNVTSNATGVQERTGGFIGWAQDITTVTFCYAAGDVVSNNTNGSNSNTGIGGFIGSSAGAGSAGIFRNCLALNNSVTSKLPGKTNRFTGFNITLATFNKNYFASDITTNGTATQPTNGINPSPPGAVPKSSILLQSFFSNTAYWYSGIAWDTSIWNIVDGALPTLK